MTTLASDGSHARVKAKAGAINGNSTTGSQRKEHHSARGNEVSLGKVRATTAVEAAQTRSINGEQRSTTDRPEV
jgi:hypothetical protein